MASLGTNLVAALRSLHEQRQRSLLSALGIMVGCLAIVLLVSIARGVQKDIGGQVEDLGINLLVVLPFRAEGDSMFVPGAAGLSYLRYEDVERVRRVPGVRAAAPFTFVGGSIRSTGSTSPTTLVIATGADWFSMRATQMAAGRVFHTGEERQAVCVLGAIAKRNLFGSRDAVGAKVTINGSAYTVLGVTEDAKAQDSMFSSAGSFANVAYVPHGRFRSQSLDPQLHRIMVQTRPDLEPASLVRAVDAALGKRLEPAMYSVKTQEDLLKLVFKILDILTWLLTGLTSIALFEGGVGIMTVMLMSVRERTVEIGLRKSVGARRGDIFVQFLFESLLLSALGGATGLALGTVVCAVLGYATPIKPLIETSTVTLALGTSTLVGAFFGILPAARAARQDPAAALRSA